VIRWAFVLAWASVIFWWSSKPGTQVPGRFSEVAHFGEYFLFGTLLYLALRLDSSAGRAAAFAIVIASLYGISDELHQHFVPGRVPDVLDWATDTTGATLAAGTALLVRKFARRQ
jgi:VanZ family protein